MKIEHNSKCISYRLWASAAFAVAAIGCANGQTSPGSFSSLPAYLAATYDVRAQQWGYELLNANGDLFGQPQGAIKPLTTITYTPTSLSGLSVPQYLNVTYGGLNFIDTGKLNLPSLGNLVSLWQSGTSSYDFSYGLDHNFIPKANTSAVLDLCAAADWKQNDEQQAIWSGRAYLEGQYAVTLFPFSTSSSPQRVTASNAFATQNANQMVFKPSDEIPPLKSRADELAAAYLLHYTAPSVVVNNEAMVSQARIAIAAAPNASQGPSNAADVLKVVQTFRGLRNAIPEASTPETISSGPNQGKFFMSDSTSATPVFSKVDMDKLNAYATQLHNLLARPALVGESFKPYIAQAKAQEKSYNGATLKFTCQGLAWYDTGAGNALEGYFEAGLVYAFGRPAGSTSSVVPGISITYLDGTAPSNVNLGKGYLRLNFIIPF